MANEFALHSVGNSIVQYLKKSYPSDLNAAYPCDFRLFSSGEMGTAPTDAGSVVSLYLYRVTVDEHTRNADRGDSRGARSLPLDLHYLFTMWAHSSEAENVVMGWTIQQLHWHERLTASDLTTTAGWSRSDVIQLVPSELSTEDLMRVWHALHAAYRLSVSYMARVIRIDPRTPVVSERPAVATRFELEKPESAS